MCTYIYIYIHVMCMLTKYKGTYIMCTNTCIRIFIKGSLDEKLPNYEVLKMRENSREEKIAE